MQNARAERLLNTRDSDSEGRRRAVEVNNLLFTSYLARAVMTGGLQSGPRELNLVDPGEGTDLLFEVLAHPLSGEAEGARAVLSVLRDVTDLRRAGHELERQMQRVRLAEFDATRERDRLNLILENVADPILVTDDQSNIIMMNDEAERLFQVREGGKRNYGAIQAIRGNDTKFTSFISEFTLGTAISRRSRMALTDPQTGRELPVEVVSGKIINEHGEPSVIVSVVHDLTKQVENERLYEELKKFSAQLEERIRAATSDLEAQNLKLQWQSQELARANRLKSEFLASMSHELRTPLNAAGHTSLLLDKLFGDVTVQQTDSLSAFVQPASSQALIDDILDSCDRSGQDAASHWRSACARWSKSPNSSSRWCGRRGRSDVSRVGRQHAAAHRSHEAQADPPQPAVERREVHARCALTRRAATISCASS